MTCNSRRFRFCLPQLNVTSATGATRSDVVESDASADESAKAEDPAAVVGRDAHHQPVRADARVLREQPKHADGDCVAD